MAGSRISHELKVGALITGGLIIALITIFSVGERQGLLKQRYFLKSQFDDVGGLQKGAPVRVSGFQVGVVNSIDLVETSGKPRVEVTLRIEKSWQSKIRRGSVARISSLGLLGDKLVEIVPAGPDGALLKNGDLLSTKEVMPPEEILARAAEISDTLMSTAYSLNAIIKKVEKGTGTLGKMIDDPRLYTNLDSVLVTLNHLMITIKSGQGSLAMLIKDPALYKNLNQSLANANAISDSLRRGQGSLGKLLREPDVYNTLDSTSKRLDVILSRMERGEGTLGKLSKDEEMYKKLKESSDDLNKLIKDLKENPKKYLGVSIF
jgi:phospholipid/cholesterol/gamma-HCH transport system substrate-binding protein